MVVPYDDPNIGNEEVLIRQINFEQHVVPDENTSGQRISSKAYSPSSEPNGGMSVDILGLMESDGIDSKEFVTTPVFTGSVAFKANVARDLDLLVGSEPIKDNPYHGEVWGARRPNRFSPNQKRRLQAASEWFVEIPGVAITK
jgi:hypothetical protein